MSPGDTLPNTSNAPRYMALAETLRSGIAVGDPPVGELLPTEHALCERYKVSRHTVREALRMLAESGLIARRRGAGTVVIAAEARSAFAQRLGGVDDLMQYARDARLRPEWSGTTLLPVSAARLMGVAPGGEYLLVKGSRGQPGRAPIAWTEIYIRIDLAPPVDVLVELGGAVTEWIAKEKGVPTARIEQSISAGVLTEREARALDEPTGQPALRTRRRYFDAGGRVIALSDSVHPGDRFTYEMNVSRQTQD